MSKLDEKISEENKLTEKNKKPWKRHELDRLGNLKTFIKVVNPGKPAASMDGMGSDEMVMSVMG